MGLLRVRGGPHFCPTHRKTLSVGLLRAWASSTEHKASCSSPSRRAGSVFGEKEVIGVDCRADLGVVEEPQHASEEDVRLEAKDFPQLMRTPALVYGRRVLDPGRMKGVRFRRIGSP